MIKIKTISIPIYFGHLRIVVTDSFTDASKKFGVDHGDIDPEQMGAFVDVWSNGIGVDYFTVFFKPDPEPALIAHEVVHLVNGIYIQRHMDLDKRNDEPQAYLTGWITEQIYKHVKQNI